MNKFSELIDEAVKLELNVSELYLTFHDTYKEDNEFWWKLAIEEKNHAALLKNLESFAMHLSETPLLLDKVSIDDLRKTNLHLEKLIKQTKDSTIKREETFTLAFSIETSAGESHFQEFADNEPDSQIAKIFKNLNQSDVDHAKRIKDYAESHGMQIKSA